MLEGAEFFGDFRIIREIGHGGMGNVYLAESPMGGAPVAVKVMPQHLSKNDQFRERFNRECASLRKLNHPGIPRHIDDGEVDGRRYVVMEFFEGRSLEWVLAHPSGGPDLAARLIRELAGILSYAHGMGVIHRDISPRNVIVDDASQIRLVDFGISKLVDEATLTMTGQHFGTPSFMAPEQFGTAGVHPELSDLWSMGAVAFHALTGRTPFEGDNIVVIQKLGNPNLSPPAVLDLNPDIPPALAAVVDRLLQKNPRYRFPSATAVIEALSRPEPDETYDPRRIYQLDDLVYLPHARRWAVVDEAGKLGRRRFVGLIHHGASHSRRLTAAPAETETDNNTPCAECGHGLAGGQACPACGLIAAGAESLCRVTRSRSQSGRHARRRRLLKAVAWSALPVALIAGAIFWSRSPHVTPAPSRIGAIQKSSTPTTQHIKDADLVVDLNTAKFSDLVRIKGLSDNCAMSLLAYRHNHGAFKNMDDAGAILAGMRYYAIQNYRHQLKVESHAAAPADDEFLKRYRRIDINRASSEELATVPFIGSSTAGDIVQYRAHGGTLRSLDDVLKAASGPSAGYERRKEVVWLDFITLGNETLDRTYKQAVDKFYAEQLASSRLSRRARVDLNHASLEELIGAFGKGRDRDAMLIMMHRHRHGAFRSVDEYINGILLPVGYKPHRETVQEQVKRYRDILMVAPGDATVTVDPEFLRMWNEPVNLNTASFDQIHNLPLLKGHEKTAVWRVRERRAFRSFQDLLPMLDASWDPKIRLNLLKDFIVVTSVAERLDLNHASLSDLTGLLRTWRDPLLIMMHRHRRGAFGDVEEFIRGVIEPLQYNPKSEPAGERLARYRKALYVKPGDRTVTVDLEFLSLWGEPQDVHTLPEARFKGIPYIGRGEISGILKARKSRKFRSVDELRPFLDAGAGVEMRMKILKDFLTVR